MKQRPNVIYILTDDMGYGDVSALNERAAFSTPNFDEMAQTGVCFTDAHATSAVCTPSRYGILTGRYNWRSRLKSGVVSGYSEPLIEPDRMTVAHLFRQNGYRTAAIGKWHLGMRFAGWTSDQMDLIKFYPDMTADMDMLAFYMPAGNVTITANYEPLPPMPPTGDDSSLPLWSALAAGSLCGMALLMRSRRRKARG